MILYRSEQSIIIIYMDRRYEQYILHVNRAGFHIVSSSVLVGYTNYDACSDVAEQAGRRCAEICSYVRILLVHTY